MPWDRAGVREFYCGGGGAGTWRSGEQSYQGREGAKRERKKKEEEEEGEGLRSEQSSIGCPCSTWLEPNLLGSR